MINPQIWKKKTYLQNVMRPSEPMMKSVSSLQQTTTWQ